MASTIFPDAQSNFITLMCARRRSGKTTQIVNLLKTIYKGKFDKIILVYPHCFSTNPEHNPYLSLKLDQTTMYSEFKLEMIEALVDACEAAVHRGSTERTLLILDDCISFQDFKPRNNQDNTHPLDRLAVVGRRANLSCIITSQVYKGLSSTLRQNADCVCLWRSYGEEETHIVKTFGVCETKQFRHIYDTATREPYAFLILDNITVRLYRYQPSNGKYFRINF
jgi:hypothetical protein